MRLAELRGAVVRAAQDMSRLGLVEFTAGNVSARDTESGLIAVTPGSVEYPGMTTEDTVLVDLEGNVVEGWRQPSSETFMHCEIYQRRGDVGGVVHTHSPWATTFAVLGREIPPVSYVISSLGNCIRVAPYATYGTRELAESSAQALGEDNAILLQNHGVLAAGKDVRTALKNAIRVEAVAELYWKASMLGEPVLLTRQQLDAVRARSRAK